MWSSKFVSVYVAHGLHPVPDIYFAGYHLGDEGLAVFFEEFDGLLFVGAQFVNLFACLAVKEVSNLEFVQTHDGKDRRYILKIEA